MGGPHRAVPVRRHDHQGMVQALRYAVEYWPYAMNALGDGRLELGNNLAERAIKPFVIGGKNFLFSDTPRGAEASASI